MEKLQRNISINSTMRALSRRNKPRKQLRRQRIPHAHDEPQLYCSDKSVQQAYAGEVVLGVYGNEDWVISTTQREWLRAGRSMVITNGSWSIPSAFDLSEFVIQNFEKYAFSNSRSALGFGAYSSIVKMSVQRASLEVEIYDTAENTIAIEAMFDANFARVGSMIEWVYNSNGESISVPLSSRPVIRAAFPFIDHDDFPTIDDYLDAYIDSDASILILIGPPGTCKTTLIKHMIQRSGDDAKVTYDPKILSEDGFFAEFISDTSRFLVMEDADEFLSARHEGNTMMHKFLNVSDGLISAHDKKIVFSTNLPSVSSIDDALMRPGRCFDVLQFRALSRAEARAVLDEIGDTRALPDGSEFTFAEIFAKLPSGGGFKKRSIGFVR